MTADFSTPTGSVNVSFPTSLKTFSDTGLLDPQSGTNPVQFSGSVKAYSGQLRQH